MSPIGRTSRDGLLLEGAARDLVTDSSGRGRTAAEARVRAEVGADRTLRALTTDPAAEGLQALVGVPVGSGFRAALELAADDDADRRTPRYLLLDDLPVAALISGYADMYLGRLHVAPGPESEAMAARQADICSGWVAGGTMLGALARSGDMPIPVGPVAPTLEPAGDPLAWHDMPELLQGGMRRRRLVEVAAGTPVAVRAMFRDTHIGPDGEERVLHEYQLTAEVDPDTGVFLRSEAAPRVLPWPECPGAALSAPRIEGRSAQEVRDYVRRNLRGVGTCTHLNDLLRSLGDVATLLSSVAGNPE